MKADKKTYEQWDSFVTMMAGGDSENEAHFTEDEWASVVVAVADVIDLVQGSVDSEYVKEAYDDSIPQLLSVKAKMMKLVSKGVNDGVG